MSSTYDNNGQTCLLCGKPLSLAANPRPHAELPFCYTHFQSPEQTARKDADANWFFRHSQGDWYLFWPDRGKDGTRSQNSIADWRAVNIATAEVRHFTYTSDIDVWLDVLGIKEAPPGEYPAWWGQKTPIGPDGQPDMNSILERMAARGWGMSRDASGMPQLPRLKEQVDTTQVPVYGLMDKPYGLQLGSMNYGSGNRGGDKLGITSLTFMNNPEPGENIERTEERLIQVRTEHMQRDAIAKMTIGRLSANSPQPKKHPPVPTRSIQLGSHYKLIYVTPHIRRSRLWGRHRRQNDFTDQLYDSLNIQICGRLTEGYAYEMCMQAETVLWSELPDLVDEVAAGEVQLLQEKLTIDGAEFWGDIIYWNAPIPVSVFRFAHTVALPVILYLTGSSYGINQVELLDLLQQAVVINDKPDLLAQYDEHMAERLARLGGSYQ